MGTLLFNIVFGIHVGPVPLGLELARLVPLLLVPQPGQLVLQIGWVLRIVPLVLQSAQLTGVEAQWPQRMVQSLSG